MELNVKVNKRWLLSAYNVHADSLSREWDPSDIQVTRRVLRSMQVLRESKRRRLVIIPFIGTFTGSTTKGGDYSDGGRIEQGDRHKKARLYTPSPYIYTPTPYIYTPPPYIMGAIIAKINREGARRIILEPASE